MVTTSVEQKGKNLKKSRKSDKNHTFFDKKEVKIAHFEKSMGLIFRILTLMAICPLFFSINCEKKFLIFIRIKEKSGFLATSVFFLAKADKLWYDENVFRCRKRQSV